MLDIAFIRNETATVKERLRKLFPDDDVLARVDRVVELDEKRRALLVEAETLQATRNKLNKSMGGLRGNKKLADALKAALMRQAATAIINQEYEAAEALMGGTGDADGGDDDVNTAMSTLVEALKGMSDRHGEFTDQIREVEAELDETMLWIPNMPHESVIVAESEDENTPWEAEGTMREFDFTPLPHWDLGPALDIIDFERGVKLHGTRGYMLKGWGARLQRALISFYLDHARENGFTEFYVPFLVQEQMLFGSAQLPKFRDTVYSINDDHFFLLPTAEVALTAIHRDEILDEADLPLYYASHTPCFRDEKMSAGRDTRGIKRVHQFEKVELYKFTTPETSYDELESLTEAASDILRKLKLPFRRLEIVSGDLGFSAAKKYDLEVWAPGSEEWMEVSSCSNTESFQARRSNIRYRPEGNKKNQYVHTLNGSGMPSGRVMIAIMENYQRADGSIEIPEVLRPYLGGVESITAPA